MTKNQNRHAQVMTGPLPSRDCRDCEEPIPDTETAFYWETSEDEQFWLHSPKTHGPVCEACWVRRDNLEPPDPDGEDFRGGEAAAFLAESQARIQRELK
jgi:hypothetical protein